MSAQAMRRLAPVGDDSPPHNLEAEQAVLGAMFLAVQEGDSDALSLVFTSTGAGDFYRSAHAHVYLAAEVLHRQGRPPDVVSVSDALQQQGRLEDAGGRTYITGLLAATFSIATLPHHLAILREYAAKRTLLDLGLHLSQARNGQALRSLLALADRTLATVRERVEFDSSTIGRDDQKNNRATAAELLTAPETVLPWWPFLQPRGVLGPGVVALLSGFAKSGKTTAVTFGVDAILRTHPGLQVAWCTEEHRTLWRGRLLRWRLNWPSVEFFFPDATPWPTLAAQIDASGAQVVIVDTARTVLGIADENDAGQWISALRPLLRMARKRDVGVLILHHLRKSGGDEGLGHAGNHALVAAVDVALELRRDPQAASRRIIRSVSRYDATPPAWVMELREDGLAVLGDPAALAQADLSGRILGLLDKTPRTTGEVLVELEDPKPSTGALYATLKDLHRRGLCERHGTGTRGAPYRWTHKEIDSSSSTPLRVEEKNLASLVPRVESAGAAS